MTFLVTLIALLVERFFDWGHLRRWQWFSAIERKLSARLHDQSPYLILSLCILPVIFIILCIALLLRGWLYGLFTLLLDLVILMYSLGPKNLWAGLFAQMNANKNTNNDIETKTIENNTAAQQVFFNNIFIEANRRIFTPIFWFLILGIAGVLLYRMIDLSKEQDKVSDAAKQIADVLDWIPVRIFTFLFALGGHFVQVLSEWRRYVLLGTSQNEALLTACGIAALGVNQAALNQQEEKNAISLLDRVFIIALVIIAMIVLLL